MGQVAQLAQADRSRVNRILEKEKSVLLSQPFVRYAPFFAAGMLTAYFGGGLWSAGILAAAFAALLFAVFRIRAKKPARFWLCAAGAICGTLLMNAYIAFYVKPVASFAGETVSTQIYIEEELSGSGQTGEVLASARLGGRKAKLRLTCESILTEGCTADVTMELDDADPDNAVENTAKGVYLTGSVTEIRDFSYKGVGIAGFFRTLRRNFCGELSRNIFGDSASLAEAMLFGRRDGLSPQTREYLKVSGAAHYTAVSGTHFTILAAALLELLPSGRHKLRFWASLLFAPAAVLFFGISPSVLRASVMFFFHSLGILMHRRAHPLNSLCAAVTIIPLFSPGTILDAGFAMSVLGVLGAGVVGPALADKLREYIPDKARSALSPPLTALSCSFCALVCTAPVSAALFRCVSVSGIFTALLLIPLLTIAMALMLMLGLTRLQLLALPIDWTMKAAGSIIKLFGKLRITVIPLDMKGAWMIPAVLAVVVFLCAFGNQRTFSVLSKTACALIAAVPLISFIICQNRHEIYFTGNSSTSAAVIINKNTAEVYIAGGGDGLAERISRIMRERGAYRITELYAADASYGGALSIKALSELVPIERITSNKLTAGLAPGLNVEAPDGSGIFTASGITIATASAEQSPETDIALYTGRMTRVTESKARLAVYFTGKEYDLPDNFRNARLDREFFVSLE